MERFTGNQAQRKLRESETPQTRLAATLDDIAAALETIAQELSDRRK